MTTEEQGSRGEVVLYQAADGKAVLDVRLAGDTVWLSQRQMSELFDKNVRTVSEHIQNVFKEGELDESSVIRNFRITAADGKAYDTRFYNLDVVISVGYRVKSRRGTQFRIWATRILREHLTRGYTLNQQRFEQNAQELEAALSLVRKAAAGEALTTDQGRGLVNVIARYTRTFLLLQRYDEGLLVDPKGIPGGMLPPAGEARTEITRLKRDLIGRGEATDLFGREREEGLSAVLGNLEQSVFGEPAYPTIESKAAHLLYFVIKNHPFSDGNKRIGSFLFVDFLNRNGRLFENGGPVINDIGLAALALLVAESDPKDKEILIRLIMNMLAGVRA
jgi:prophage maintenance system killer protein